MGFDVTAANIIFFIAALSMGSVALGAYWHNAGYVEEAQRAEDARADMRAHTNMTVVSAQYNGGFDRFTVDIKNTGSEVIDISELRYIVDGVYVASASVDSARIEGGPASTDLWLPLETLEVQLSPIDPSPTYFQVVTQNGVKANWRS